jgi:hypothetical protein
VSWKACDDEGRDREVRKGRSVVSHDGRAAYPCSEGQGSGEQQATGARGSVIDGGVEC